MTPPTQRRKMKSSEVNKDVEKVHDLVIKVTAGM
jgi:hypothetical protein